MGSGTALHQICTVDEENDLGIMFSRNFKFRSHIHKMVQKANKVLGVINRTFKYLDPNIMHLYMCKSGSSPFRLFAMEPLPVRGHVYY